jgi:hypothetical protein
MATGTVSPAAVLRDARFAGSSGRGVMNDINMIRSSEALYYYLSAD